VAQAVQLEDFLGLWGSGEGYKEEGEINRMAATLGRGTVCSHLLYTDDAVAQILQTVEMSSAGVSAGSCLITALMGFSDFGSKV
jgi:hypothetical protein